mgnify:CR=1 FL=1
MRCHRLICTYILRLFSWWRNFILPICISLLLWRFFFTVIGIEQSLFTGTVHWLLNDVNSALKSDCRWLMLEHCTAYSCLAYIDTDWKTIWALQQLTQLALKTSVQSNKEFYSNLFKFVLFSPFNLLRIVFCFNILILNLLIKLMIGVLRMLNQK